jgi:hypothetical protein
MFIDLKDQRFGRLVAKERDGKNKFGSIFWKCLCDCGKEKRVVSFALLSGGTTSCGCYRRECLSSRAKRPYESLYNSLMAHCQRIGREFGLTYEDFVTFTETSECYYCGDSVVWAPKRTEKGVKTSMAYNLDRRDTRKGYTVSNCVVCCWFCNAAKADQTYPEFIGRIGRIHARHNALCNRG